MSDIDMTGLSLDRHNDWEKRKHLINPDLFEIDMFPSVLLLQELTEDECNRLADKLVLVRKFARAMAAGMVKGTIKYPKDTWGKDWKPNMMGELADAMNYVILKEHYTDEE